MLGIIMVHRCFRWVELFYPLPPSPLAAYIVFLEPWKLDHRKEALRTDLAWNISSMHQVYVFFAIGAHPQFMRDNKGYIDNIYYFGSHLSYPDKSLKTKFLLPGIGVFVSLWFL